MPLRIKNYACETRLFGDPRFDNKAEVDINDAAEFHYLCQGPNAQLVNTGYLTTHLYDVMIEVEALKAELARRKEVWEELGFASREDFEEWKAWNTAAGVFDMRAVARAKEKYGSPEEFAKQFAEQFKALKEKFLQDERWKKLLPEDKATALVQKIEDATPFSICFVLLRVLEGPATVMHRAFLQLVKDVKELKSKVKRSWFV